MYSLSRPFEVVFLVGLQQPYSVLSAPIRHVGKPGGGGGLLRISFFGEGDIIDPDVPISFDFRMDIQDALTAVTHLDPAISDSHPLLADFELVRQTPSREPVCPR
jgi:hypothetical protein